MPRRGRASLDAQRLAHVPGRHAPRAELFLRRLPRAPVVKRADARRVPRAHALCQQRGNHAREHIAAAARAHAVAARDVHRHILALRDDRRCAFEQHARAQIRRQLLRRLQVKNLALPDVEEDDPLRREILALAEGKGGDLKR